MEINGKVDRQKLTNFKVMSDLFFLFVFISFSYKKM